MKVSVNFLLAVFLVASTLVVLSVCATVCTEGVGSNGSCATVENANDSNGDWVPINSVKDLNMMRYNNDWNYKLMSNIDLTGFDWEPITNFKGKLDGQNHTISNISSHTGGLFHEISNSSVVENLYIDTVNITNVRSEYISIGGVVGVISNSKDEDVIIRNVSVRNVSIDNVCVDDAGSGLSGNPMIGGFVGRVGDNVEFSNISVDTVSINNVHSEDNNTSDHARIGGFAGYINDPHSHRDDCKIEGKISVKNVTISNITADDDTARIGGFVGDCDNDFYINAPILIDNVTISGIKSYDEAYVGGFAGYNDDDFNVNSNVDISYLYIDNINSSTDDVCIGSFMGCNQDSCLNVNKDVNINTITIHHIYGIDGSHVETKRGFAICKNVKGEDHIHVTDLQKSNIENEVDKSFLL